MSLFSRVKSWLGRDEVRGDPADGDAPAPPAEAPVAKSAEPSPYAVLALVGAPKGPSVDEAIALLRRARGTLQEAEAVAFALEGVGERAVPEPVRVACADLLAARGDEAGAMRVLEGARSTPGLVLLADLYASSGQLARAVGTIERVLARDIAAPGARERHARWCASLGYARAPARKLDEATVVAPTAKQGPFRLVREIARGGAGAVYEAEDEGLGRRVAFKVYHGRGRDRAALEREVRFAEALAGPGIVRVFDADPGEGWMALEWIARGSVRDRLRAGDLEALAAIDRWAAPLARSVARIHALGFVHADVKPANVLLRSLREPVLSDFGITRRAGEASEGGSPGYVSPERLAGRASDPRDDVYGFGRVVEDVLHALEERGVWSASFEPWRALSNACIGPDEHRARDGAELVLRLP